MGNDVSKPVGEDYRGVGITSAEWLSSNLVRNAAPTFTEANPRPGVAQPKAQSGMVLETSGEMKAVDVVLPELTITANKGGHPGASNGRFTWNTSLPARASHETEYGWEAPNAISRSKEVLAIAGSFSDLITLQSNILLNAWLFTLGDLRIVRKVFDGATYKSAGTVAWTWDTVGVVGATDSTFVKVVPDTACFFQLPNGRVHLYYAVKDSTVASRPAYQVVLRWSDDDGLTWTTSEKYVLDNEIDAQGIIGGVQKGFDVSRMRVAYTNGQALMIISGNVHDTTAHPTILNCVWQFASNDLGNTFQQVDISGVGGFEGAYAHTGVGDEHLAAGIDITVSGTSFVISYNAAITSAGFQGVVYSKSLATAWTNWNDVTPARVSTTALNQLTSITPTGTSGILGLINTSISTDDTGAISIVWHGDSTAFATPRSKAFVSLSQDGGATWLQNSADFSTDTTTEDKPWWNSRDSGFYPVNLAATRQCGRLIILANMELTGQNQSTTVREFILGGYSTATRAFRSAEEQDHIQGLFDLTWMEAQRLQVTAGWAATGAGTETVLGGEIESKTTAGQTLSRRNSSIDAVVSGEMVTHGNTSFEVSLGTASVDIYIDDGTSHSHIQLQASSIGVSVIDVVASSTLASATIGPVVEFYWTSDWVGATPTYQVWARETSLDNESRAWLLLYDGTQSISVAATAGVASYIGWELPQTSTARLHWLNWGSGIYGRPGFRNLTTITGAEYRDTIFGRAFSPNPVHVHAGEGPRIAAVDGPAWESDSWVVTQRHEYGLENIFPDVSNSPDKTWRSESVAISSSIPQESFVVKIGEDGDPAPWLDAVMFISARNVNFPILQVNYRKNSAAGWTSLGVVDFTSGLTSLAWARDGKVIQVNSASHANEYFTYDSLTGSHFKLSNTEIRAIAHNSEGAWTANMAKRPRIKCDDIDGTEASNGAGAIWMKDGVLIIHNSPHIYELQFVIPTSSTAEGYLEVGSLNVGHVAYFGKQYARGRVLKMTPNFSLSTGRSGVRRGQALGKARRAVEISWANENNLDHTQLTQNASGPEPDYILPFTGSADPVASPADTDLKVVGLIEHLQGATTPLLYLPQIPMVSTGGTDTMIVNPGLHLTGRVMSDAQVEVIMGSEGKTEMTRMSRVLIEEEV